MPVKEEEPYFNMVVVLLACGVLLIQQELSVIYFVTSLPLLAFSK
jgi:hypothetical protein